MPACRTNNKAKRAPGAESQLVWAIDKPQPHAPAVSVSVSVDITPADADSSSDTTAMPPLVDYPPSTGEFIMFPPPSSSTSSPARRTPHSKKKPENHIPRPPNAFILFRSSFIKSQHVSTAVETNHSTLSKIIGLTWSSMREEERQVWYGKAKEALDEHRRRFPKYAFRPTQTKARAAPGTGGGSATTGTGVGMGGADAVWVGGEKEKRRVREVEPKDITRCAKIAQLLVEGKKGAELNAAVEEFDRTHVPQIVTRFEAPITARAFRRSSSAPVPDGSAGEGSGFLAHVQNVKAGTTKPRARSTRPARSASPPNASANAKNHSADAPTGDMPLPQDPAPFAFSEFTFDSNAPLPASPLELELECDPLSPFAAFTAQPFSPTSFSSPAPSYSTPSTAYSTPEQSFVTPSHSHSHSHSHAYSTPSSTASAVAAAAGLTIDTSFSHAHHSWAAPQTPQTPYMTHTTTTTTLSSPISLASPVSMSSSPTALSSPISTHSPSPFGSASSAFDAFDAFFADPFPALCGGDGAQDAMSQSQHAMSQNAMPSLSMDMGIGMMCGEAGLGGSYTSYADTSYLGMGVDMGLGMGLGLGLGMGDDMGMNLGMGMPGMDAMGFAEYLRVPASYA